MPQKGSSRRGPSPKQINGGGVKSRKLGEALKGYKFAQGTRKRDYTLMKNAIKTLTMEAQAQGEGR